MRIQSPIVALGLALLIGGATGCVNPTPAAPDEDSAALASPPTLPKAATKPPPPRPRPVFATPPRSFDPLIGTADHDLFDPASLQFPIVCCPIHGTPLPAYDPLVN